jgi:hypothetical protein
MAMDPVIFNQRVEQLLEPTIKSAIKTRDAYRHEGFQHRQESLRLGPKPRPCTECDLVTVRTVQFVLYAWGTKKEHWKRICTGCDRKVNLANGLKDIKKEALQPVDNSV